MTLDAAATVDSWDDAMWAAAVLAVDPPAVGGLVLRVRYGPTRGCWLAGLEALVGERGWPRLPPDISDERLLGGLDLAATLGAGRPVYEAGVLKAADGGLLILPSADRVEERLSSRIAAVMDTGEIAPGQAVAAFGLLALDEGVAEDERVPAALAERLALHCRLDEIERGRRESRWTLTASDVVAARQKWPGVRVEDAVFEAFCSAAAALGIASLRAPALAVAVARIVAALNARDAVNADDVARASRLVLGPRATQRPRVADDTSPDEASVEPQESVPEPQPASEGEAKADEAKPANSQPPQEPSSQSTTAEHGHTEDDAEEQTQAEGTTANFDEIVLEAAAARLPAGLLDAGASPVLVGQGSASAGGRRTKGTPGLRGRPIGVAVGMPKSGQRLNVIETLRAAAPWQRVRGRSAESPRLRIRREDCRVTRFRQPRETATIFAVDASGSSALHRLAEAKGAVELLLADCYVRRDRVGLVAFRGRAADALLAPTRSLARARRCLAALAGGGPTPLASGIDSALIQARLAARQGATPLIVVLTDGRGNIARDGRADRAAAGQDTESAAQAVRAAGYTALVIDTSPRARDAARLLAERMGARYLPLPLAGASQLSDAIRAVST